MKKPLPIKTLAKQVFDILPENGVWSMGWGNNFPKHLIPVVCRRDEAYILSPEVQLGGYCMQLCIAASTPDATTVHVFANGNTDAPGGSANLFDLWPWLFPFAKNLWFLVKDPSQQIAPVDWFNAVLKRQPWTFGIGGNGEGWALSNLIRVHQSGEPYYRLTRIRITVRSSDASTYLITEDKPEQFGWVLQGRFWRHWAAPLARQVRRNLRARENAKESLFLRGGEIDIIDKD